MSNITNKLSKSSKNLLEHGKSFLDQTRSILNQISKGSSTKDTPGTIHDSHFDEWTLEDLISRLEQDGVEVPVDANPRDLILFAKDFYLNKGVKPVNPNAKDSSSTITPKYTTSDGTTYLARPSNLLAAAGIGVTMSADGHVGDGGSDDGNVEDPTSVHHDPYMFQDGDAPEVSLEQLHQYAATHPEAESTRHFQQSGSIHAAGSGSATAAAAAAGAGGGSAALLAAIAASETGSNAGGDEDRRSGITSLVTSVNTNVGDLRGMNQLMSDQTQQRIKNEFKRPNVALARVYADLMHPRKPSGGKYSALHTNTGRHCFSTGIFRLLDPFREGTNSELARYGVGISLYFKFAKWLFWTFMVMFLVTLPEIVINAAGGGVDSSKFIDLTTLGHLAEPIFVFTNGTTISNDRSQINPKCVGNGGTTTTTTTNGCQIEIIKAYANTPIFIPGVNCGTGPTCELPRVILARWYTAMDLLAVIIFVISLRWLKYFEKIEATRITKHHITVEEYTIQAVRVPRNSTEDGIKSFFERLTGEPVADVFLIQNNGALLDLYIRRGKLVNKLWNAAAKVHLLRQEKRVTPKDHAINNERVLERRVKQAVRAYDHLYAQFEQITERRARIGASNEALSAFITFETQEGFLRAMDLYPQGEFAHRRQPTALRLDPKRRLKVRQAPPPSTIKWENTHYSWQQRRARRYFTGFITAIALAISVVTTYLAQQARIALDDLLNDDNGVCAILKGETVLGGEPIVVGPYGNVNGNQTALFALLQDSEQGNQLARQLLNSNQILSSCFCSLRNYAQAFTALLYPRDTCNRYFSAKAPFFAASLSASAVISIVNVMIQFIIFFLAGFEKHHSIINMELSIVRRVFVVLTLNTGFVLLIVNARVGNVGLPNVFNGNRIVGTHADFDPEWYANVGGQIILTMIINCFTPHVWPLFRVSKLRWRQNSIITYSQRELNELYLGPVFFTSFRLSHMTMTVFVVMLFSSGMPILYLICCAMTFVHFYVDKWLLFNFYRTPPAYSSRLQEWTSSWMSWSVVGHLGFACWMLSCRGVFWDGTNSGSTYSEKLGGYLGIHSSTSATNTAAQQVAVAQDPISFQQRMLLDHIIPIYIFLILFLLGKLAGTIFRGIDAIRARCCSRVTCGIFDDGTIKRRYLNPNYHEALQSGLLRGLTNYNMLENPTYARALGIGAEFAKKHKHIASVHRHEAVDLPDL
jgi:hypothetical protein